MPQKTNDPDHPDEDRGCNPVRENRVCKQVIDR
jgi:hypothetical protein